MSVVFLQCLGCLSKKPPKLHPREWSKLEASLVIEEGDEICQLRLQCVHCGREVGVFLTNTPTAIKQGILLGHDRLLN